MKPRSYNPLDYSSLSESLSRELMGSDIFPLSEIESFYGGGVYALFYSGDFPAYKELSRINRKSPGTLPIYIGSAAPKTNKGYGFDVSRDGSLDFGNKLYERIRDHRNSIQKAANLDIDHFSCHVLVLDAIWVPLAESALIAKYIPVWNSILTGFGNHQPGKGRRAGKISRWDTVHPGRGRETETLADWNPGDLENEIAAAITERVRILGLDE